MGLREQRPDRGRVLGPRDPPPRNRARCRDFVRRRRGQRRRGALGHRDVPPRVLRPRLPSPTGPTGEPELQRLLPALHRRCGESRPGSDRRGGAAPPPPPRQSPGPPPPPIRAATGILAPLPNRGERPPRTPPGRPRRAESLTRS